MLIFILFLVSVNILMVKTQNDVVKVIIKQGTSGSCIVRQENALTLGAEFNLEVSSDFFIKESTWTHNNEQEVLEHLENSVISVSYNKTKHTKETKNVEFKYNYSHTRVMMGHQNALKNWTFSFTYLINFDPWSLDYNWSNVGNVGCNASVRIKDSLSRHSVRHGPEIDESDHPRKLDIGGKMEPWVIYVLSFFGLFLVVQSSYIVYGKVKGRRSKGNNDKDPISPKSPKGKKRSKTRRNIADRPPLPLPSDEDVQTPPQPTISPGPVHKQLFPTAPPMPLENSYCVPSDPIPLVSKPSYRHQGLNTSDQGVTSPVFDRRQQGPLVPNQSYRNKALVASVEELRTPGCHRRHIDGPLVQKQSYRNKAVDTSLEELRTPGFPRRHMDGPLVPKQSYRSKALEASLEELRTPGCPRRYMDGPIVPKPTYRNSVCISDDSDEEHKAPGFARRQIEAKLAQLPPKGIAPSKSFKLPRPLPRSPPSPTLERVPPFNPAHRPEPVPPLHPKKAPVFPTPAPFRKQEPSRMSDDEWQYEHLQPSSKYLNNNFSTTNNYNR